MLSKGNTAMDGRPQEAGLAVHDGFLAGHSGRTYWADRDFAAGKRVGTEEPIAAAMAFETAPLPEPDKHLGFAWNVNTINFLWPPLAASQIRTRMCACRQMSGYRKPDGE